MHVLIDRLSDAERAETIEDTLRHSLDYVRAVVGDGGALTGAAATARRRTARHLLAAIRAGGVRGGRLPVLADLREHDLPGLPAVREPAGGHRSLAPVPGSGLGILRDSVAGPRDVADQLTELGHRRAPGPPAADPGVRRLGPDPGRAAVRGACPDPRAGRQRSSREHRFLGVLTPRALNAEITTTPVLRLIVQSVLSTLGAAPDTYTGQRAMDLLATYPRAELFWADPDLVVDVVSSVLQLASRRRLRAFLQPDPFGRFVSVMVYLPRYTCARRIVKQIIKKKAYAYFKQARRTGRRTEVDDQVLTPLKDKSLIGTTESRSALDHVLRPARRDHEGREARDRRQRHQRQRFRVRREDLPEEEEGRSSEAIVAAALGGRGRAGQDEDVDTFHIVILDQSSDGEARSGRSQSEFATMLASYGGARVKAPLRLRKGKEGRRRCGATSSHAGAAPGVHQPRARTTASRQRDEGVWHPALRDALPRQRSPLVRRSAIAAAERASTLC